MLSFRPQLELRAGEDLLLRVPTPAMAEVIFGEIERSRQHLRRWMPWLDSTNGVRDTRRFLRSSLAGYRSGNGFSLALLAEGEFAGMLGFHGFDRANRITSIGYWLGQSYCGRGLMTAAVRSAVDYAFESLEMNRIGIRCASGNLGSRRIPERLGFTHEGTHREAEWLYDHYVDLEAYALLCRDWRRPLTSARRSAVSGT